MRTVKTALIRSVAMASVIAPLGTATILPATGAREQGEAGVLAQQIIDTGGVGGGLIVHINCGDGKLTAALRASDSFLVHGLDADGKNVEAARRHIQSLGLDGRVSVEQWDGKCLQYVDNLVSVIVTSGEWRVAKEELLRVLAPRGVAISADLKSEISNLQLQKPWPGDISEWTHYLHDASGNAVPRWRCGRRPTCSSSARPATD